jgi:hypothetical protein
MNSMQEKFIKALEEVSETVNSEEKALARKFQSILSPLTKILRFIDNKIIVESFTEHFPDGDYFVEYYRQNGLLIYKNHYSIEEKTKTASLIFSDKEHSEQKTIITGCIQVFILRDGSLLFLEKKIEAEHIPHLSHPLSEKETLQISKEISILDLVTLDDFDVIEKQFMMNCKLAIEISVKKNPKKMNILKKIIEFFNTYPNTID